MIRKFDFEIGRKKPNWRIKVIIVLVFLGLLTFGFYKALQEVNNWFATHYFKFNPIIELKINKPIEIRKREIEIKQVIKEVKNLPEPKTTLEKYICDKFGVADCKIAIAVAKAESGLGETKYHVNKDGSIDIGIFQINSVHWSKPGCSPKELFDAYKNVDCAYKIWEKQGWTPWVAYQSGSFINHLK
jgi:hypothetical protein